MRLLKIIVRANGDSVPNKYMKIKITKTNETVITLARKIGYRPIGVNGNEYNIIRPINRNPYPRFHIYIKKDEEDNFFINLHLDQKRPSYGGSAAHSGEYEGEVVEREAERIKNILANSK